MMPHLRRTCFTLIAGLAVLAPLQTGTAAQQRDSGRKPSLSLKVSPSVASVPARIRAAAELRGGSDDFADFYCASVEWEWGDGTTSEASSDCPPYEAGKSAIQRNYSSEHTYRQGGSFRVVFRLKQKSNVVGSATASVNVRGGLDEDLGR